MKNKKKFSWTTWVSAFGFVATGTALLLAAIYGY